MNFGKMKVKMYLNLQRTLYKGEIIMLVCNFDMRYLEIALLNFKEIDDEDYGAFVELIGYFQCNPKYSLDFPTSFKFKLPNGKKDTSYDNTIEVLKSYGIIFEQGDTLYFSKKGMKFFKKLEKKCMSVEESFNHYRLSRC